MFVTQKDGESAAIYRLLWSPQRGCRDVTLIPRLAASESRSRVGLLNKYWKNWPSQAMESSTISHEPDQPCAGEVDTVGLVHFKY